MKGCLLLLLLGCARAALAPTARPSFIRAGNATVPLALASAPGAEFAGALAARGNRIVYCARVLGNVDLYAQDLTDHSTARLTTHPTDDVDPVLAPDGRTLAWVAQAADVQGDVWLMDIDDPESARALTDRTAEEAAPAFSADGATLYFASRPRGTAAFRIEALDVRSGVRSVQIDQAWDPAPGAGFLAYVATDAVTHRPRVMARRASDGRVVAVGDGAVAEGLPRAHADAVYFVRFDGALQSIWRATVDEALFAGAAPAPWPLTPEAREGAFPAPLGEWFAYTAGLDVWALPEEGAVRDLTQSAALAEPRAPLRQLALRRLAQGPQGGAASLYLARELTRMGRYDEARRAIAASAAEGVQVALVRIDLLSMLGPMGRARTPLEQARVRALEPAGEGPGDLLLRGELRYAVGRRAEAHALWRQAMAGDPEWAATALHHLAVSHAEVNAAEPARRYLVDLLATGFADLGEDAVTRALDAALTDPAVSPEEVLQAWHGHTALDAEVRARRAALQMARDPAVAVVALERLVDEAPLPSPARRHALWTLGSHHPNLEARVDAYKTLLRDYSADEGVAVGAEEALRRLALQSAVEEELRVRATQGDLAPVRRLYQRVPGVFALRRAISLGHELGIIASVRGDLAERALHGANDPTARYALGYAWTFPPMDLRRARREVEAALRLSPRMGSAHLTLGWIREQLAQSDPIAMADAALDSYYAAVGLLAEDDPLWADAQLNLGNASRARGLMDVAFRAYLARANSRAPFFSPATERLFYRAFARTALLQGHFDVAIDMGKRAMDSLVVASAYAQTGGWEEAREWYLQAGRSSAALRGLVSTEQALGLYDDALAHLSELVSVLRSARDTPHDIPGLFVSEQFVDKSDVTRARYGFSVAQEQELAAARTAEVLAAHGQGRDALAYAEASVALLRRELQDTPAVVPEMIGSLHRAALLNVEMGDVARAYVHWQEALPLAEGSTENAYSLVEALLDARLRTNVAWPAGLEERALQLAANGAAAAPGLARLAEWLHRLRAGRAPTGGAKALWAGLDEALANIAIAEDYRVLWAAEPLTVAAWRVAPTLTEAITAFEADAVASPVELGAFLEDAVSYLLQQGEAERAWRLLERAALGGEEPVTAADLLSGLGPGEVFIQRFMPRDTVYWFRAGTTWSFGRAVPDWSGEAVYSPWPDAPAGVYGVPSATALREILLARTYALGAPVRADRLSHLAGEAESFTMVADIQGTRLCFPDGSVDAGDLSIYTQRVEFPEATRELAFALLRAGVPTVVTSKRRYGSAPLPLGRQLEGAVRAFLPAAKSALTAWKAQAWESAQVAFTELLRIIAFLRQPEVEPHLRDPAALGFDGKMADFVAQLPTYLPPRQRDMEGQLAEVLEVRGEFSAALTLRRKHQQHFQLGQLLRKAGDLAASAEAFSNCPEARCALELGRVRMELLQFDRARSALETALQRDPQSTDAWRALGLLHERRADYKAAAEAYARHPGNEVDVARALRSQGRYGEALALLASRPGPAASLERARLRWYQGDYARARSEQEVAVALAQGTGRLEIQAQSLGGLIALRTGDHSDAERTLRSALTLARAHDDADEVAAQLNNLGAVRAAAHDPLGAVALYREALAIDRRRKNREGVAYDLRALAAALAAMGRQAEAAALIDEALAESRAIGNRYNELQCLLVHAELVPMDMAIALLTEVASAQLPELRWRALHRLGRLSAGNSARAYFAQALDAAPPSADPQDMRALFLDAMVAAGQDRDGVYSLMERARGADPSARLPVVDGVVLSYFLHGDTLVRLGSDVRVIRSEGLDKRLHQLRASLRLFADVDASLQELGELLLHEAWRAPPNRVVVLTDESLDGIPLSALRVGDAALLDIAPLVVAPSGAALARALQDDRPLQGPLMSFAPAADLPFTALQARAVAGDYARLGASATAAAFQGGGSVVDFAGHADDRGLLFWDGAVAAASAPVLVSLSACASLGAARGFLQRGSRYVVATTQRVSDLAAALMVKHFFRGLTTHSPAVALQVAAQTVRARFAHPAHWGSFVLLGDPR
jgi:tetratricopeptide (TPR) repeat protein